MKLTEQQIWKCNNDGDGGVHICVDHQNVVDFAKAIEREIGFARAELWIKRINDAVLAEREAIALSMDKQADLAPDDIDRQWAQEMAAAIRNRGKE